MIVFFHQQDYLQTELQQQLYQSKPWQKKMRLLQCIWSFLGRKRKRGRVVEPERKEENEQHLLPFTSRTLSSPQRQQGKKASRQKSAACRFSLKVFHSSVDFGKTSNLQFSHDDSVHTDDHNGSDETKFQRFWKIHNESTELNDGDTLYLIADIPSRKKLEKQIYTILHSDEDLHSWLLKFIAGERTTEQIANDLSWLIRLLPRLHFGQVQLEEGQSCIPFTHFAIAVFYAAAFHTRLTRQPIFLIKGAETILQMLESISFFIDETSTSCSVLFITALIHAQVCLYIAKELANCPMYHTSFFSEDEMEEQEIQDMESCVSTEVSTLWTDKFDLSVDFVEMYLCWLVQCIVAISMKDQVTLTEMMKKDFMLLQREMFDYSSSFTILYKVLRHRFPVVFSKSLYYNRLRDLQDLFQEKDQKELTPPKHVENQKQEREYIAWCHGFNWTSPICYDAKSFSLSKLLQSKQETNKHMTKNKCFCCFVHAFAFHDLHGSKECR